MLDQWRRLALPRARHDIEVRDDIRILDLRDRLAQEILRDGEVEQRIVWAPAGDSISDTGVREGGGHFLFFFFFSSESLRPFSRQCRPSCDARVDRDV